MPPALRNLLLPPQPKAIYVGKPKKTDVSRKINVERGEGDVSFEQMTVDSFAIMYNSHSCPPSIFQIKLGDNANARLSMGLSLVKVTSQDTERRSLTLRFLKPIVKKMTKETATRADAFKELTTATWEEEATFSTDADLAGSTFVAWDRDEGDVHFPKEQYDQAVTTIKIQLKELKQVHSLFVFVSWGFFLRESNYQTINRLHFINSFIKDVNVSNVLFPFTLLVTYSST